MILPIAWNKRIPILALDPAQWQPSMKEQNLWPAIVSVIAVL